MSKMYTDIQRILQWENTRPIYDGIAALNRQLLSLPEKNTIEATLEKIHLRDDQSSIEAIRGMVNKLIDASYDGDSLILQNPNYGFLSFWEKRFLSLTKEGNNIETITNMMLYLSLLDYISRIRYQKAESEKEIDDLPYLYENLCGAILRIAGCDNCFIIHHVSCGDTHIVARSAYLAKEITDHKELTASAIAILLEKITRDEKYATNLHFGEPINDGKYTLVPLFSFSENTFYVLLQFGSAPHDTNDLVKFLFARSHLKDVISRDYEHLLNLRYELGFIRFFKEGVSGKLRYPTIIHASDLHADKLNEGETSPDSLITKWTNSGVFKYRDIDLLVISGDIVDARSSNASQIQDSYDYASRIIRKLAAKLWDTDDGRISFDWKRRIILVPGNHDFAAMNLVKAMFKQRTLAAGLPYDGKNKIVAKFAYYLDFLQELLDPPIDQLIRDGINEVREYRRMNTKVLMLNSSFDASSSRTNKVRINENIIRRLTSSEMWEDCSHADNSYRVCVIHHPPFETIDYNLDGYDVAPDWKWGEKESKSSPINTLYDKMLEIIKEADVNYDIRNVKNARGNDYKKEYDIENEKMIKDPKLKDIETINREGEKKGKLYFTKDAETLYRYCAFGTDEERAQKIVSDIQFNVCIAKEDQDSFDNCIQNYVSNANIILSGHVHAQHKIANKFAFGIPHALSDNEKKRDMKARVSIVGKMFESGSDPRMIRVSEDGSNLIIEDYSMR